MRKGILGVFIAIALVGAAIIPGISVLADTPVLDHVQITPANVTLATGATQQFSAQGYDVGGNATSTDVGYLWSVINGGGSINSTGVFIAGTTAATFSNTVRVIAVQGGVAKVATANVTVTSTAGILDHILVSPATVTLPPSATQQFVAEARDAGEAPIAGLTFNWAVVQGGGTINGTGFFTANATTGTFLNTVQASATQNSITKNGTANVTVAVAPAPTPVLPGYIQKLATVLSSFFNKIGFNNLINVQLQVKNGTATDTIKLIPGVVQAVSGSSLTVLPNGQTANTTFTLEPGTVIIPNGSQLAVNDKVMVVTINDKVIVVIKIIAGADDTKEETGLLPPGLSKKEDDKREGKEVPPGWSRGKKVGWSKNHFGSEVGSEREDD